MSKPTLWLALALLADVRGESLNGSVITLQLLRNIQRWGASSQQSSNLGLLGSRQILLLAHDSLLVLLQLLPGLTRCASQALGCVHNNMERGETASWPTKPLLSQARACGGRWRWGGG